MTRAALLPVLAALATLACAEPGPRPLALGTDACAHCHMTVTDPRYAAELVTRTGKVFVFDDAGCLAAFYRDGSVPVDEIHSLWVYDFREPSRALDAMSAVYLRTDSLRTPMGSGLAALPPGPGADSLRAVLGGDLVSWEAVVRGAGDH